MKTKLFFMILAMQVLPVSLYSQTKFHDVEAIGAWGTVKSIKQTTMGKVSYITFSEDGKLTSDELEEADYDAYGFMRTAIMNIDGLKTIISFQWEDGRVKTTTTTIPSMKMSVKTIMKYNSTGSKLISESSKLRVLFRKPHTQTTYLTAMGIGLAGK